MFIQSCFIRKNTKYLRDKLEELGYAYNGKSSKQSELSCLYCCLSGYYECREIPGRYESPIDCGTNEELFLAIAALRNNSDYMQWFTNGKNWYQNKTNDIEIIRFGPGDPIGYHKATIKELIEHFK